MVVVLSSSFIWHKFLCLFVLSASVCFSVLRKSATSSVLKSSDFVKKRSCSVLQCSFPYSLEPGTSGEYCMCFAATLLLCESHFLSVHSPALTLCLLWVVLALCGVSGIQQATSERLCQGKSRASVLAKFASSH